MEELKPCPFCGGLPEQDIIKDGYTETDIQSNAATVA